MDIERLKKLIDPRKIVDKQFYLDLLDENKQDEYEKEHIQAVLIMLRVTYINNLKRTIKQCKKRIEEIMSGEEYGAEQYNEVVKLKEQISSAQTKINTYKPFFEEPYFARMDLYDEKEGYNSYYIGKKGDERLEIVDWRAPLARKYYQKSQLKFSINEYDYKLILRRAIRAKNGKVISYQNEYLSLKEYLTKEEIAGRDEEIIFDPFLKEVLKSRKEKSQITDIIETIQEKQYDIITMPEDGQFIVQGVAGSGKTMIMLHRLSYLMYNNESIKPRDVLLITPSDSFNSFIDELSTILELERVRTSTIDNYFISVLFNEGIKIEDKIDYSIQLPPEYMAFIYSEKFISSIQKKLNKVYEDIKGMFSSPEVELLIEDIIAGLTKQTEYYTIIKNTSLRVRRCILGEIKENSAGDIYFTKEFRALFNCVEDVKEFLSLDMNGEKMGNPSYFYKQLSSFYTSLRFIRKRSAGICQNALADLLNLDKTIEREIVDLSRYKTKIDGVLTFTHLDRIEKRKQTRREIARVLSILEDVFNLFLKTYDFADVISTNSYLSSIGKCRSVRDVLKFFYRECVQKIKASYKVSAKKLNRTDAYILCLLLVKLGYNLAPKFAFIFVDEGQDISLNEYYILRRISQNAKLNIFGDLKQNITKHRGIYLWEELSLPVYTLAQNYRNTHQIVELVSSALAIEMQSIGFMGDEIDYISRRGITRYLQEKNGLTALIVSDNNFDEYVRKSYNIVRESKKISKSKINLLTVYESKGLEFTAVVVDDRQMSDNERYIAYTRALKNLAIVKNK